MKAKLLFLLLPALCVAGPCGRFASSTTAVSASLAANKQPVRSAEKTLDEGLAALKSEKYDQAIRAAKQVLSASSDSNERIESYPLLITTVIASDDYDPAIRRRESVYAFARWNQSPSKELASVGKLLADLKQRRSQYLRTIAEQQRIIRFDKDRAAAASLKLASCKKALGPRDEAIRAYETIARDYPPTRQGWKALEELAWMRQPKNKANATKRIEPTAASLSDGLQALKQGRLSEAEKTARALLASSDTAIHSGALDLLTEVLAKRSGSKVAARQV